MSTSMGTLHCVILLDLDPPISKVCAIKLLDLDVFTSSLVIAPTQTKALIPVVRNKDNILYFASHKVLGILSLFLTSSGPDICVCTIY